MKNTNIDMVELPGLNCGSCGYRTCEDFRNKLKLKPSLLKRCTFLSDNALGSMKMAIASQTEKKSDSQHYAPLERSCSQVASCGTCLTTATDRDFVSKTSTPWIDSLGREFDFYLEHFPKMLAQER